MQLPVSVTRAGGQRLAEDGLTRNISSGGVLFRSHRDIDIGGPIEYVITLSGRKDQTVNLRCIGKVLRFERHLDGSEIAATLERYEFIRSGR